MQLQAQATLELAPWTSPSLPFSSSPTLHFVRPEVRLFLYAILREQELKPQRGQLFVGVRNLSSSSSLALMNLNIKGR